MEKFMKGIKVMEKDGVYMVPAELEDDFVLVPEPEGKMNLVFWDKNCLILFLENYGFSPVIIQAGKN